LNNLLLGHFLAFYYITKLYTIILHYLYTIILHCTVLDAPYNVKFLPYGEIAEKYINQINDYYDNIKIDSYVIMPDHIHAIIVVKANKDTSLQNGASRTSPPTRQHSTIPKIVSTFKRFCNKEYGENIWQESYYDHIIRDNDDYATRRKYICENPIRWYYKNKNTSIQ